MGGFDKGSGRIPGVFVVKVGSFPGHWRLLEAIFSGDQSHPWTGCPCPPPVPGGRSEGVHRCCHHPSGELRGMNA